jgi:hypothetical protein
VFSRSFAAFDAVMSYDAAKWKKCFTSPACSLTQAGSTPRPSSVRSPGTATMRVELFQRYRNLSSFSSEPGRTRTQIVPRRWSTSSAIRRRPMNPVAPVTK